MSKIALSGDASGTGTITLASANTNSSVTFVLPSADGTNGQVIQTNGSGVLSFGTVASGGDYIMQVFTSPGTWTKPSGLKAIKVTVVGGGGGSTNAQYGGTGGGGGGTSIEYLDAPAIPGPQPYTVGTGGSGGTGPSPNGGAGGTSSFGGPTAFLSATGGAGGSGFSSVSSGVGSNGQLNIAGGRGSWIQGDPACGNGYTLLTGGHSFLGGLNMQVTVNGSSPPGPGAPLGYGVGGASFAFPGPQAGYAGGAGVVIVEEFY